MASCVTSRTFDDGDKNGNQLTGFGYKWLKPLCRKNTFFQQQFEPIQSLIGFFQTIARFGNKFGLETRPICFPVISPDRSAGTQDLFPQNLRHHIVFWQSAVKTNDPSRKHFRAR